MNQNGRSNGGGMATDDVMAMLSQAMQMHRAGDLANAETLYKLVLGKNPRQFDALHFMGVLAAQRGRLDEACDLIGKSLKIDHSKADAFNNYARVLNDAKRHEEGLDASDRALKLSPNHLGALLARGNALLALRRYDDALATFERAVSINSYFVEALVNRGLVLSALGRNDEALASADRALAINPKFPQGSTARATALAAMNRPEEAIAAYDQALALAPQDQAAIIGRGQVFKTFGRLDEAAKWFGETVARMPDFAEAHYQLGLALYECGRREDAARHIERALELQPDHPSAPIDLCVAQLPVLYRTEAEIAERRAAYEARLRAAAAKPPAAMGSLQPFYLPYQGQNDRALQDVYGGLVCRIMHKQFPAGRRTAPPGPGESVRVGIVTRFFQDHTIWKLFIKGWLDRLDRKRFQVFGYHTAPDQDEHTAAAAKACERFTAGMMPVERWREAILRDAPHVLLYPEIGMDPMSAALGALRLAPVQCTTFGHPETTGYPTIDYFLTSDLMEPEGAEAAYTEQLVRLPNIGLYYEPAEMVAGSPDRAEFELRPDTTVYWCGQSLYKYLPQYDQVFPRIAREVPNSQFVFIAFQQGDTTTDLFRERLERAFADHGLSAAAHCVFLPRLAFDRFIATIDVSDVALDSIGWSGGNTALECLARDLPIVTLAGPLMRGRHSAAFLKTIGLDEAITPTLDDYVATAVRLGNDASARMALRRRVAENKHRLFRDDATIAALEKFLAETVWRDLR